MADIREQAIEAGARAMYEHGVAGLYKSELLAIAAAVVDAVEPIIRADECLKSTPSVAVIGAYRDDVLRVERERLRAQVEANRERMRSTPTDAATAAGMVRGYVMACDAVVALLDGEL
jgi:hypothetical protein